MTPLRSFFMTFTATLALLLVGHSAASALLSEAPVQRAVV